MPWTRHPCLLPRGQTNPVKSEPPHFPDGVVQDDNIDDKFAALTEQYDTDDDSDWIVSMIPCI